MEESTFGLAPIKEEAAVPSLHNWHKPQKEQHIKEHYWSALPQEIYCISRGGQANFYLSPQIVNSQILVLILLLQIRKYLRYASPQIANLQIFMNNPEIANPLIQNNALLCLAKFLKVVFLLCKSAKQKKDWACNLFADRPPLCIRFYFPIITYFSAIKYMKRDFFIICNC